MEMCSEDGDTGRVSSAVSTFKEPLRSQRKNCVCLFGGSGCTKYSYISQDDGAGGQVPEETEEVNQGRSQELQNGRGKAGSKARFTSTAPLSMWSGAYSHGKEWRKEAGSWHLSQQEGSERE